MLYESVWDVLEHTMGEGVEGSIRVRGGLHVPQVTSLVLKTDEKVDAARQLLLGEQTLHDVSLCVVLMVSKLFTSLPLITSNPNLLHAPCYSARRLGYDYC